eukprot:g5532.t1
MNMRIRQLDVSVETKTQDNVFVHLVVSVQYQVIRDSIFDAFYKLTDSKQQIKSYVFDVVRSSVPKLNLDDVFISKEDIAGDIKQELTKSMGSFGFTIIQTLVTDIVPNEKVKNAMNEINAATRLRAAAVEKAEAQKITVVKNAEADAEAKYLAGQGIARQRQAIIAGLRDSVVAFHNSVPDIGNRDVMSMMMMTQYFDCLKDVGLHSKNGTIFLPHNPGAVGEIASQVRDGALQANAMSRQ